MKKFSPVFGIIAVILIFSLFAIGSGSDKASVSSDSASDNSKTTTQKADEPVKVKVGETLTTNTLKITYKSSADDKGAEYFPAASGNKIIKLTFEIENISSTDQIVSVYDFKCYSDDVASSAYYYGDNGLSTTTLSSGRKATGNVYFEVPQNANSIDVEYETNYWSGNKAIFVVK
jgi:hypothetical protein